MDPAIVVTVASLAIVQGSSVFAVWLRLCWRARNDQAQQACLAHLALYAPGTRLKIDDDQGDGRRLRICLNRAAVLESKDGVT